MATTRPGVDRVRATNLDGIYNRILSGKQTLGKPHAKLFVEAVYSQPDPVTTVQRLLSNSNGSDALRTALCSDDSASFINSHGVKLLRFLQDRNLHIVYGGSFLRNVLTHITQPSMFWDALVRNVRINALSDDGLECFGWLLLELLSLTSENSWSYQQIALEPTIRERLEKASNRGIATNINRIKSIVDFKSSHLTSDDDAGPGGRHDNDSADIRDISILPTFEELQCKEEPYLRRPTEIELIEPPSRLQAHLDNQFRLLREDMLRELREELKSLADPQKGKRKAAPVDGLSIHGLKCNDKDRWSLKLQCATDLLFPLKNADRLKHVKENSKNFFRHESVCCIVTGEGPLALVSIDRDEQSLAEDPPVICVRFPNTKFLPQTLVGLRKAQHIQLIQLSTSIFAYEPVLKQLQKIDWLKLGDELMYSNEATSLTDINASHVEILDDIEDDPSFDLQVYLELSKPTCLDASQVACFQAGLTQKISLVQGPPGGFKTCNSVEIDGETSIDWIPFPSSVFMILECSKIANYAKRFLYNNSIDFKADYVLRC